MSAYQKRKTAKRPLRFESLEGRLVFASLPLGATEWDTAEYMLGRVAVTPVFLESNGEIDPNTETWNAQHKAQALANIREGLQYWVDLLATKSSLHTLEWVIDTTWVDQPSETAYEPIRRRSNDYLLWVPEFLSKQGFSNSNGIEANVRAFNQAQREKLNTDWSFTIFVVNSQFDSDGMFTVGGTFSRAFAFAGGMFHVVPSTRPASTFAHETGHIFYARDEYAGGGNFNQRRGYYDTQNTNALDQNPTPNFVQQPSIMSSGVSLDTAYQSLVSPNSTLAQIGWQDSDNDQIFDVLDVPLALEGSGRYRPDSQSYLFVGSAFAQALPNRNSTGLANSITLNRVTDIQYRISGTNDWTTIAQPNLQTVSLDLSIPIAAADVGKTIEIRALDRRIGITSSIYVGTIGLNLDTTGQVGLNGVLWNDDDVDGEFDAEEVGRPSFGIQLLDENGTPLSLYNKVSLQNLPNATLRFNQFPNVIINNIGLDSSGDISVGPGVGLSGKTLKPFSVGGNRFLDAWNGAHVLELRFNSGASTFKIESQAVTAVSRVRLRAYDQAGNFLESQTYELTPANGIRELMVHDERSRIRRVTVEPIPGSVVELGNFEYGIPTNVTTDGQGVFRFDSLPTNNYRVRVQPFREIYHYTMAANGAIDVAYSAGQSMVGLNLGIHLPETYWTNRASPLDLTADGRVSAVDLLQVVNALKVYRSGVLEQSMVPVDLIVDANVDGRLSSLDLLAIVNQLVVQSRLSGRGGGGDGEGSDATGGSTTNEVASSSPPVASSGTPIVVGSWSATGSNLPDGEEDSQGSDQVNNISNQAFVSPRIGIPSEGETAPSNDQDALVSGNSSDDSSVQYLSALDQSLSLFKLSDSLDHLGCGCGMCGCS